MGKTPQKQLVTKNGKGRRAKTNRKPPTHDARNTKAPFSIVGIGASAGGLEALDLFLRNSPADSGMAFVIVQHLEPTQKDFMVELLQRATAMKVSQVRDRTLVRPNCVYVIPPEQGNVHPSRGAASARSCASTQGFVYRLTTSSVLSPTSRQDRGIGVIF